MFKKYLYIVLLIGFTSFSQSKNWLISYDTAIKEAKNTNKNVLIYFTGSDWCTPCKELKSDFFDTEEFDKYASKFVLLKLDYPRRVDLISDRQREENKKLLKEYNFNKTFPKVVIITPRGSVKGVESGYGMLRDPLPYKNLLDKYVN